MLAWELALVVGTPATMEGLGFSLLTGTGQGGGILVPAPLFGQAILKVDKWPGLNRTPEPTRPQSGEDRAQGLKTPTCPWIPASAQTPWLSQGPDPSPANPPPLSGSSLLMGHRWLEELEAQLRRTPGVWEV